MYNVFCVVYELMLVVLIIMMIVVVKCLLDYWKFVDVICLGDFIGVKKVV